MHRTKWKGNWNFVKKKYYKKRNLFQSLYVEWIKKKNKRNIIKSSANIKNKNWWLDQWNKIKLKEETQMSWTLRGFTRRKKKKYRIKESEKKCGIYNLFIKHDKEIPLDNLKDNNRKRQKQLKD